MDDEDILLETIGAMLESLGYTAVCYNKGHEVMSFFQDAITANRKIDGMILDLTIRGGMGAIEIIKQIRKMDAKLPVFVISGYTDSPIMENPGAFGFTASICKPFRKPQLGKMLEMHVHSQPGGNVKQLPGRRIDAACIADASGSLSRKAGIIP